MANKPDIQQVKLRLAAEMLDSASLIQELNKLRGNGDIDETKIDNAIEKLQSSIDDLRSILTSL